MLVQMSVAATPRITQFILTVGGSQGWERRINGGAATSWPLTQNAAETRESSNTAASNLKQQPVFATILVQMTVAAAPRLILRSRPYDPPALRIEKKLRAISFGCGIECARFCAAVAS